MRNAITSTKQNHALEHATIGLLIERMGMKTRLAGRASRGCFYIYGNLPTETVGQASADALTRLRNGDAELALSPFCGTNIAVAGILAGMASTIALGKKNRLIRLPQVLAAAIMAVLAAQPLGRLAQKYITISTDVDNVIIVRITRKGKGARTVHTVETTRE